MNQSIKALNSLQNIINQAGQQANNQLKTEIEIRNEVVNTIRERYLHDYHQVVQQISLEIHNFSNLKIQYEKTEAKMDAKMKEKFEAETMTLIKNSNIEEYKNVLANLYDMDNKKDKLYYEKTVESFTKRLKDVKTAFDCAKSLKVLEECQKTLQTSDEDSWVENHEDVKKAQEILKSRTLAIGTDFEKAIQNNQENVSGLPIGKIFVQNEFLKEWYYQENLLKIINGNYENHCLKMNFNDMLNDYVIVSPQKKQLQNILQLLEFSTLLTSTKEAVHIYYDYPSLTTLLTTPGYDNCEKVTIDDDFVARLNQEIEQDAQQRISIFIENGTNLNEAFKNFIKNKPDHVQIVICQPNENDKDIYENFLRLKYYHPHNGIECFVVNGQYDLYLNKINSKGFARLQNSQPVKVTSHDSFEKIFKQHLGEDSYMISKDTTLPFEDNLVIVSKDEKKRTLFLTQMLLQRLYQDMTKYIYYENYDDHPLRYMIDNNIFEEIMPDMIEEMMDDFLDQNNLVILVNPQGEVLDYATTLLDAGHVMMTNDKIIDGYKNLDLDENVIEEFGEKRAVHFELLSDDVLNKLQENK